MSQGWFFYFKDLKDKCFHIISFLNYQPTNHIISSITFNSVQVIFPQIYEPQQIEKKIMINNVVRFSKRYTKISIKYDKFTV